MTKPVKADTKSEAFRAWFGNSKVVDARGKPKVVYHGTSTGGFSRFDEDRQNKPGFFFSDNKDVGRSYSDALRGKDPLFEPARTFAELQRFVQDSRDWDFEYDDGEWTLLRGSDSVATEPNTKEGKARLVEAFNDFGPPGVYAVYLRMITPLVIDAEGQGWGSIEDPIEVSVYDPKRRKVWKKGEFTTDSLAEFARKNGYDGLIVHNVVDMGDFAWGDTISATIYVAFDPRQIKSIYNTGTFNANNADIRYNPRRARQARPAKARRNESCRQPRYWGRGGAGMMFVCPEDSTALLLLRAAWVDQGGTWGVPGGGIGEGYYGTPISPPIQDEHLFLAKAKQEVEEECGSLPPGYSDAQIIGRTAYTDCGFQYVTYIVGITKAQKDAWRLHSPDGETDEFRWFPLSRVREGGRLDGRAVHFGVAYTLGSWQQAAANPRRVRRNSTARYVYHLTYASDLPSLAQTGLVPQKDTAEAWDNEPGVYFVNKFGYEAGAPESEEPAWLRIPAPEGLPPRFFDGALHEAHANQAFPPSTISVWVDGRGTPARKGDHGSWKPLLDVVRRNPRRARRNEASATTSPAFRRWFGGSRLIDKNGQPQVVYHGTKTPGHTVFTPREITRAGTGEALSGVGLYFSTEPREAASYAGEEGAVYPVYLRLENPFIRGYSRWRSGALAIATAYLSDLVNERYAQGKVATLREGSFLAEALPPTVITQMLRADGYDGVVDGHILMVLDGKQVKSATGNRGTFDVNDADIRHNPRRTRRARRSRR
jgi:hypothetical protein